MRFLLASVSLLGLTSCAAIFDGTSQNIMVNTNPSGARCDFTREGATVASIPSTPGSATVQKTKHDLTIICNKAGYASTSYLNHSGVAGAAFADVLGGVLTGGVAWAVDSSTGADNKYDGVVNMSLESAPLPPTAHAAGNPAQPTS